MRNLLKIVTFCLSVGALISCGTEKSVSKEQEKKEIVTINTTTTYNLNAEGSEVTWDRYLHQGPTKKKVKLFGADAEIELVEVELTTTGGLNLSEGVLKEYNESITSIKIDFDMTTFKLNTNMEKGDDLFKSKEYGSSSLIISEIIEDSVGYVLNGDLEIAGVTNPVFVAATIEDNENSKTISGELIIQTLDWPLRDESAKKSVIKDEVTIQLKMVFEKGEVKQDSVVTYE